MRIKALIAAALLLLPLRAFADDFSLEQRAQAKRLYDRAVIHYRSGELEKAAAEFKESFETRPTAPLVLSSSDVDAINGAAQVWMQVTAGNDNFPAQLVTSDVFALFANRAQQADSL